MSKRETYERTNSKSELATLDKSRYYAVDQIRDLYIKTETTLERIAMELRLPLSTLERMARTGELNWHSKKLQYQLTRVNTISSLFTDGSLEMLSLEQRLHMLTIVDLAGRITELESHVKKYGDLRMRDDNGDIVKDAKGQAIHLSIPNTPKDLMAIEGIKNMILNDENFFRVRLEQARVVDPDNTDNIIDVTMSEILGLPDDKGEV